MVGSLSAWLDGRPLLEEALEHAAATVALPPSARAERQGVPAPEDWEEWLRTLFPRYVTAPFVDRHRELWDWVWAIDRDSAPRPFVAVWPRGGAKTTSAELAVTALGVRGRRAYAWYVGETQDKADKNVENIASLLESEAIERHYPEHAQRALSKYGTSRGWRRSRLRTAGGFTVDALGLDTAARGLKVDEQRPDLIILDDIDGKLDSPATTARKLATITTSLLPAGAWNAAVLAVQNLIIPDGVFTRLVDGRADYLARRIVSGPFPAIEGLVTERREDPVTHVSRDVIVGGRSTWEGQSLERCQELLDRIGLDAFLKECQHEVKSTATGRALRFDEARHVEDLTEAQARSLVALGQVFGGIDFGSWRFGVTLRAVDEHGRIHQLAEWFSQRHELEYRARVLHAILAHYGVSPSVRLWGDAANPTDIMELNAALRRIDSRYRVVAVGAENKIRRTSVDRLNDLLGRRVLLYRRSVQHYVYAILRRQWQALGYPGAPPDPRTWRLGMNASSAGVEMAGSRLLWEIEHWSYPAPREGEAQVQDPDDHTADGADLIAAERYALMSWWRRGEKPEEPEKVTASTDSGLERLLERVERAKDGGGLRRTRLSRKRNAVTRSMSS